MSYQLYGRIENKITFEENAEVIGLFSPQLPKLSKWWDRFLKTFYRKKLLWSSIYRISSYDIFCDRMNVSLWSEASEKGPLKPKIQQTKMLVTCQKFCVCAFLSGLVWRRSANHNQYNKGRFKVMATYLQLWYKFEPTFIYLILLFCRVS